MTEQVTRRNFFKLLGGGVALVIAPSIAVAEKIINIPIEFGWTWYVDKNKVPATLSEIITKTLRENTQKICENIGKENALLVKLKDGQKLKLNIEQISEQKQNERICERQKQRMIERERARIDNLIKTHQFKKEDEAYLRNKSERALANKQLYEDVDNHAAYIKSEIVKQDYLDGKIPHPFYRTYINGTTKITPTTS